MQTWQIVCVVIAYLLTGLELTVLTQRYCDWYRRDPPPDALVVLFWPLVALLVFCCPAEGTYGSERIRKSITVKELIEKHRADRKASQDRRADY